MEENDVLDDLNEEQPDLPEHRQRCFRFLWYTLGIVLVMIGRLLLAGGSGETGAYSYFGVRLSYLFSLGVVGVWLFAGLGSLAGIRAIKQEKTDLLLIGALTMHLVTLSLSTGFLYNLIFVLE
ncbi:MAG: hypothetical protein ACRBG0_23585 [Lewinella sp.]|jgi:hypothetical protein|uniref:hypothetical protein n=1 Tax=Lewinella sp. TaxID=2004506 RepID=UPI003D6A94E4